MMRRPTLAFAMAKARTRYVLDPDTLSRLATLCEILDPEPIEDFGTLDARDLVARAEILVTGWGCPLITADVLAGAPHLRLIAHAAGTVKFTVVPEAYTAGISVTHAAEANAIPVAEYTLAMILLSNKRAFTFRRLYRQDHSRHSTHRMMDQPIGNFGRTVGIIGASRIGRRVIRLLQPFDVDVLLYDPHVGLGDPILDLATRVSLEDSMALSDVISVHAPSLPSTQHLIGAPQLRLMRDGATLINTARGALIDETALLAELETGRIDAVIDVTDPEIPAPDSRFYDLPNVFLTPHIAGAIGTERSRLGALVADEIERFVTGAPLLYAIEPKALEYSA